MKYQHSPEMEARLADNRDRIMRATRALIAQGGFREVTISAVARHSGLSSGAIYRYFPSKSDLYVQALIDAVDHEVEILRDIVEPPGQPAKDRLRAAIRSFSKRALKGPHLAYAFIAEPIDPQVDAGRIACRARFGEVFMSVLRDGIRRGEFPDQNVEISAACLVGAFTEALIRPVAATERPADEQQLIDSITRFCFGAVVGVEPISAEPAQDERASEI